MCYSPPPSLPPSPLKFELPACQSDILLLTKLSNSGKSRQHWRTNSLLSGLAFYVLCWHCGEKLYVYKLSIMS